METVLDWLNKPKEREPLFTPNPDAQALPQAPAPAPLPEAVKPSPGGIDFMNFDPDALKKESQDVADRKANLGIIGAVGDALSSGQSFGNFYTGKMNQANNTASRMTGAVADSLEDPVARQAKLYGAYKQAQEAKQMKEAESTLAEKKDPNSRKSMAMKALAPRWGVQVTPEMSAFDIEQLIDPKKMMETEAAAKVDFSKQKALKEIEDRQNIRKEGVKAALEAQKEANKLATDEKKEAQKKADEKVKGEKEFRNRYKSINDELAALNALIDQKGTYEALGSHNAELAQKIDSIAIDSAKLFDPQSVARESEVAAFKKMLFEPGALTTRNSTAKDVLKSYQKMLERRAKSQIGEGIVERKIVNRQINKNTGQTKLIYDDGSSEIINSTVAGAQ